MRLVAGVMLIIVFPFLVILSILIRMESKGSPLFRQKRVGKGGKIFIIYKLRTMRLSNEPINVNSVISSVIELKKLDSLRITYIGKHLRKFHIDELPQLWNILKNEMTFIGPRPLIISMAKREYYAPRDENIRPGLTGLAQISSLSEIRGYNVSKLDKFYCKKICLMLNFLIIIKTIVFIIRKI